MQNYGNFYPNKSFLRIKNEQYSVFKVKYRTNSYEFEQQCASPKFNMEEIEATESKN
ncbi:hypothetical protein J2X69_003644 [Algoriphagus sp. 4150]|nr:hypothetical protein [Algoriphagus sp. 4150]